MAIKSFKHKGLKKFFETGSRAKILPSHAKKLALILDRLDASSNAKDMNYPGSQFHGLEGKLNEHFSVHVSGNWVITFRFEGGHAWEVDYLDYH